LAEHHGGEDQELSPDDVRDQDSLHD
jgi:hypothetical protein